MIPGDTFLLEKVTELRDQDVLFIDFAPCTMEEALRRARIAFDAGWQFTPDEVRAYTARDGSVPAGHFIQQMAVDTEDEIDEIPAFFSLEA